MGYAEFIVKRKSRRCHWRQTAGLGRLGGLPEEPVRSLIVRGQVQRPVSILRVAVIGR